MKRLWLIPFVLLAACNSTEHAVSTIKPTSTTVPTTTAVTTTTVKPTTTAKATTTTTRKITQFEEVSVVAGSLQRVSSLSSYWNFQLSATNHSSKTSNYTVKVICVVGDVQQDGGYKEISAVPSGETRAVAASCSAGKEQPEVRILSVERDAT